MAVQARAIISDGQGGFADAGLELGEPGPPARCWWKSAPAGSVTPISTA